MANDGEHGLAIARRHVARLAGAGQDLEPDELRRVACGALDALEIVDVAATELLERAP